ncbi:DUF3192 domain-containing protein [Alkalimonas collagenimarina]|uniref:DUF3192 domain-containing protein n=1 Tax=Alkalimonas collagenimarina TaxID=400390 RepID=A0ABT9GV21_9GAMM|nr:DUF3192 domain-containing protein [Alkalimonas collagenimarina]MDP4534903.1 DUF3192 domain-containing protein [Alkalimonas collagenimarina]
MVRVIAWLAAGLVAYLLITLAIVKYYPDDPSQMNWQIREAFNAKYIQNLKLEDDVRQQQVIDRLGGPDITRAYRHDGEVYQLLYYRTHRAIADGITTEDECTALFFIERQLVAIGHEALERYEQHRPINH